MNTLDDDPPFVSRFAEVDDAPDVLPDAIGWVNLLGEHPDHNGGQALLVATEISSTAAARTDDDAPMAVWLDTLTLEQHHLALPKGSAVLVLDSGIAPILAADGRRQRMAECREAAQMLGVASLREIDDPAAAESLPEPLRRRVRHVVSENARVQRAMNTADAAEFGVLLNASHASLRDDYAVSVPELDRLVDLLQSHPKVYGARLTGPGFGGECVALCDSRALLAIADEVLAAYADAGLAGSRRAPLAAATSSGSGVEHEDADHHGTSSQQKES